jgi:hypothetical protein
MNEERWLPVAEHLRKLEIEAAIRDLERELAAREGRRFKSLVGGQFSNPEVVLATINDFIRACGRKFALRAIYLEMNGFDINCARWYFDSFGYARYEPGEDDLEWLCECLVRRALDSSEPALGVPVLATAHDFDVLGRFEPRGG